MRVRKVLIGLLQLWILYVERWVCPSVIFAEDALYDLVLSANADEISTDRIRITACGSMRTASSSFKNLSKTSYSGLIATPPLFDLSILENKEMLGSNRKRSHSLNHDLWNTRVSYHSGAAFLICGSLFHGTDGKS